MFNRYEYQGINYAKSAYLVTADTQMNLENKSVEVLLKNEFTEADIRYILDDGDISLSANKYAGPIQIKETTLIKASLFKNDKPLGKELNELIKFHKAIGKKVTFKEIYHDSYKGAGDYGMVNSLRGSKNFHDGQWQAWLGNNMEAIIDLEKEELIRQVTVGSMENQGPGIYFPVKVSVFVSNDGIKFQEVGNIKRDYARNAASELKDFKIVFEEQKARYVKVIATNLKRTPSGGNVWMFIDEILID